LSPTYSPSIMSTEYWNSLTTDQKLLQIKSGNIPATYPTSYYTPYGT